MYISDISVILEIGAFVYMFEKTGILHIETETYPFFKGQKLRSDVCSLLLLRNFVMANYTSVDMTKDGKQIDLA